MSQPAVWTRSTSKSFTAWSKRARCGRTVFLSSHILSEVEQTCTRVGIIREGQLVRVGGVAELKDIKRHEVTITFAKADPAEAFETLDGVEQVETLAEGHTLRLIVSGGLDSCDQSRPPCIRSSR